MSGKCQIGSCVDPAVAECSGIVDADASVGVDFSVCKKHLKQIFNGTLQMDETECVVVREPKYVVPGPVN